MEQLYWATMTTSEKIAIIGIAILNLLTLPLLAPIVVRRLIKQLKNWKGGEQNE